MRVIDNHRAELSPIPIGWTHTRMKTAVKKYQNQKNQDEHPTVLSLTKKGIKVKTDLSFGKSTESYIGHQIVSKGQFVFTPRDFDATPILCGISNYNGCISNLYIVFDVAKILYPKFLEYYFYGLKYGFDYFEKLSFGMRFSFNQKQFEHIPLIYPNLQTQKEIADFLDCETDRIDQLIEKKESFLRAVSDKRSATITHAVTNGIKNDVPCKNSGIDWLGEIPDHWTITKLKYIGKAVIGLTYSPDDIVEEGEGILVLRSGNIQNGKIAYNNNVYVNKSIPPKLYTKNGDILICSRNGSRDLIGKNALIDKNSEGHSFGAFTTVFRTKHSEFIYYVMNSELFTYQSGLFLTSTINQLTTGTLNNFEVPLPPESEQKQIVDYIQRKIAPLESLERCTVDSISKLKLFRTSLITEAVTGQLDIKAWKKKGGTDKRLDNIAEAMAS